MTGDGAIERRCGDHSISDDAARFDADDGAIERRCGDHSISDDAARFDAGAMSGPPDLVEVVAPTYRYGS